MALFERPRLPARAYFSDLSTRLQRYLGLDTEVPVEFTPNAVPVVLVGDLTLPGFGVQLGRRFSVGKVIAGGGATHQIGFKAQSDLLIESIQVNATDATGSELIVRYTGPDVAADPMVIATADAFFLDRALSTDLAPLLTGASTPLAATGNIMWRSTMQVNGLPFFVGICPFLLVAGARFHLTSSGIADMRVNVFGRLAATG